MSQPLSVTQALAQVKGSLEQITATIVGEVSEVSDKPGYKAIYFTISDSNSALSCLIWRSLYERCEVALKQGMLVEVSGLFSLYMAKGRMNFDVKSIRLAGEGELRLKVAQLAKKLQSEGLMDPLKKRSLPLFPETVCVVTSPRGKAIHDVIRTLRRRFPLTEVLVAGIPVEGIDAAASIIRGLEAAQASSAEIILLVRGGGSYEDLMPFNDESLARAVASSSVPVVTGIGHEPDTTIADMVADYRASTPTAAAEYIVPDGDELKNSLNLTDANLTNLLRLRLEIARAVFYRLRNRDLFSGPLRLTSLYSLNLDGASRRLSRTLPDRLARDERLVDSIKKRASLIGTTVLRRFEASRELYAAQLSSLSPLSVLGRGYSIAYDQDNHIIDSIDKVDLHQQLRVRLSNGLIDCQVNGKHPADTTKDRGKEQHG